MDLGLYWKGFLIAWQGAPITLAVTLCAIIIGVILGFLFALMKLAKMKFPRAVATVYIDVMRGTPLIVQALIVAFGIPQLLNKYGVEFNWSNMEIVPAIIVCGLNSAAYVAEIIRSGLQAVDTGQTEAARSLGMSSGLTMRIVIIPQAFRIVLPALGNEVVTLVKETAVLSFVGVVEILRRGVLWNASSFETFPAYIGVALVYLCITMVMSRGVTFMERRLAASDRGK